jgi:hypothetical protein
MALTIKAIRTSVKTIFCSVDRSLVARTPFTSSNLPAPPPEALVLGTIHNRVETERQISVTWDGAVKDGAGMNVYRASLVSRDSRDGSTRVNELLLPI